MMPADTTRSDDGARPLPAWKGGQVPSQRSLTIVVACLNEEPNLRHTCENIAAAVKEVALDDYEIVIVDDGSRDRTGQIADEIAASDRKVQVIHHPTNQGFGASMQRGIETSRMSYMVVLPGDNEISLASIKAIMRSVGRADIILPFTMNMEMRPRSRRFVSRAFSLAMNTAFLCDVQYYNGPAVHRVDLLRWIGVKTSGFAFQAVMVTKILRMGFTVCEVPMYIQPKAGYRSSAVRLRNIVSVAKNFVALFYEIYSKPNLYPVPFSVRRILPD
ncbi:Glycosyltransferase involved in cell wall bisynthesis [Rhodospirillales bacterium URHD0017]|nr:Glycosyltransferase involved in cell wall bisynthesis [Rhodospirillales bacterium URHD0017]